MRVQFTVNNAEWTKLQTLAQTEGYPDVPSYCRDVVLQSRTYGQLWQTVVNKISKMEKGKVFVLRDLIDTPPANLGVKLYEHQNTLGIQIQKKDSLKTNQFVKL